MSYGILKGIERYVDIKGLISIGVFLALTPFLSQLLSYHVITIFPLFGLLAYGVYRLARDIVKNQLRR